jgi:ribosomal-protein-alanine N-acetyltransferase
MSSMIQTQRLILIPLSYNQLIKYARCDNSLEQELNVRKSSRTISPELREAIDKTFLPKLASKNGNSFYSTLWTAILKSKNEMIGDLCIIDEPNEAGEIEIGYGTYDEFQRQGYMTEVVSGIIKWAAMQDCIRKIIASTEKVNIASARVLQKNNFIVKSETENDTKWALEINQM